MGQPERVEFDTLALERLARAYHEQYRAAVDDDATDPATRPWDELSEHLKDANRASARAVADHLDALGLTVRPVPDGAEARRVALPPDLVEQGARREHRRWMQHMRDQGYVYGPDRDDTADPPTHPDLASWEHLDEPTREKDRVRIRDLPELLATVGLEIVENDT